MPQIDSGAQFGNSVAQPRRSAPRPVTTEGNQAGVLALAQAGENLTTSVVRNKRAAIEQQVSEEEARGRELARRQDQEDGAKAAAALVDYELEVRDITQRVSQDLTIGKLPREKLGETFAQREGEARSRALTSIPAQHQAQFAPRFKKLSTRMQAGLAQAGEAHRRSELLGNLEHIRDGMAKLSVEPDTDLKSLHEQYELSARAIGPEGGMQPKEVTAAVQDFKDRTTSNFVVARINDNIDDMSGLQALKKQVKGSVFKDLDPERRNIVLSSINAAISRLESRQEADRSRVLTELAQDMVRSERLVFNARTLSDDSMLSLSRRARGTPLQGAFEQLKQTNDFVNQFKHAPLVVMEQELVRLNVEVDKNPTPGGDAMISALKTMVRQRRDGLENKPYETAVESGAPFAEFDMTTPDALARTFESRIVAVRGQRNQNPGAGLGIFMENEVGAFKHFIETAPPEERAARLGQFAQAMNDPVVFAHSMRQITKESKPLAQAGMLVVWGSPQAATKLMEGQDILAGKGGNVVLPSDAKFAEEWRGAVGDAYGSNTGAEADDFESVKAIYAALVRDEGKTTDKEVLTKYFRQAVAMGTGGIGEHNDGNVVLPYGVDEKEFRNRVHGAIDKAFLAGGIANQAKVTGNARVPDLYLGRRVGTKTIPTFDIDAGGLTSDHVKEQRLETIGQGQYRVRAGNSLVTNEDGNPLVLDLRTTEPKFFYQKDKRVLVKSEDGAVIGRASSPGGIEGTPLDGPINPNSDLLKDINAEDDIHREGLFAVDEIDVELSNKRPAPLDSTQIKRKVRDK